MAADVAEAPRAPIKNVTRRKRLTATLVEKVNVPGRYGDGGGLYLIVDPSLAKRYVLRVQVHKRRRDVGLGSIETISLEDVRILAAELRKKAKAGLDPVTARHAGRVGVPTFEECAKKVHAEHVKKWRPGKHVQQWLTTLETYAYQRIGKRPVNKIETEDIAEILLPIWIAKAETARKVLHRIGTVLDYAMVMRHRSGENPCRLVTKGLPKQSDIVKHHASLAYIDLPAFIPKLRAAPSADVVKLAMEFLILTLVRSKEVREARVEEFNIPAKVWTIPGPRMKEGLEHIVPLSPRAIAIFEEARRLSPSSELLFPGFREGRPLSDMTLGMVLRRFKLAAVPHGFRTTFRTWTADQTQYPRDVLEIVLSHKVLSKVEAAYQRSNLLEKRRPVMDDWARFVLGGGDA